MLIIAQIRLECNYGDTTYEPLPRLLAETALACIPHHEPEVARAKIIALDSKEVMAVLREQVGNREMDLGSRRIKVPTMPPVLVPNQFCVLH